MSQSKLFAILCLWLFIGLSTQSWNTKAYGQNLQSAQDRYQKGDLKGAEQAARKALTTKISRPEKAKIYKILGLVQYTLGHTATANQSFQQALLHDPNIAIQQGEALDPSVIGFFQNIKSKKQQPTAPAPSHTASARGPAGKNIAGSAPMKKTMLKVNSNIARAQVSLDGILAGTTNELINAEPGKAEVQVEAAGYLTRRAMVTIVKDAENAITVNLEKPKPPEKPKPKPAPPPTIAANRPQKVTPKAPVRGKPASGARKPASGGDDLFAPTPSGGGNMAAGGAAVGGGVAGPDPAAEFENEARTGMASPPVGAAPGMGYPPQPQNYPPGGYPPQQGYPQGYQQGYQQGYPQGYPPQPPAPVYAPPPIIYQSPPTYIYPPSPAMSQPVPDPYSTGQAAEPPLPPDPVNKSSGSDKNNPTLLTIMPFGIGQLSQGRYLVGAVFAASQSLALYLYLQNGNNAQSKSNDLNAFLKGPCNAENNLEDKDVQECDRYSADQKKRISQDKSNQQLALMAFAGSAVIGVLEAVMWDPSPPKAPPKRRKSRSKKYRGFSQINDTGSPDQPERGLANEPLPIYFRLKPHLVSQSVEKNSVQLGAKIEISTKF